MTSQKFPPMKRRSEEEDNGPYHKVEVIGVWIGLEKEMNFWTHSGSRVEKLRHALKKKVAWHRVSQPKVLIRQGWRMFTASDWRIGIFRQHGIGYIRARS